MKKFMIVIVCIGALLQSGCRDKEEPGIKVTFVNEVYEADIWVLPQTQENLKTTLWGKAMAGNLDEGKEAELMLTVSDETDRYIIRVIDSDQIYYAADGVYLEEGYRIRFFRTDEYLSAAIEVYDMEGKLAAEYEMFSAAL